MQIKEIRETAHMSQSAFARKYNIPLSTLQHWEQNLNSPPRYFLDLLARDYEKGIDIYDVKGKTRYTYYPNKKIVDNLKGISLPVEIRSIDSLEPPDICSHLDRVFEDYKNIIRRFDESCEAELSEEEQIGWNAVM